MPFNLYKEVLNSKGKTQKCIFYETKLTKM